MKRLDSVAIGFAFALTCSISGLVGGGCLGGDGKPSEDPDAGPTPDAIDLTACQEVMRTAPEGGSFEDALPTATVNTWDGVTVPAQGDPMYPGGKYRTLTPDGDGNIHPGCSTAGLSYTPAVIDGYPCAAKEYPFPDGVTEDTSKPIVILVHGNSDTPTGFEPFLHPDPASLQFPADETIRAQLSELLPAAGFRTIAADLRFDLVDDPAGDNTTANAAKNMDHGWSVPIVQELILRVLESEPQRQVSVLGFSLGATVVRDALRRLFAEFQRGELELNVFTRVRDVIAAAGANHGVSSGALCSTNFTMRGTVTCEMGQRNQYAQTAFHQVLNGPAQPGGGETVGYFFETPCADGDYAYGVRDACGGNAVQYTSITMSDLEDGTQQDLFVSEYASRLHPVECATNVVNGLNDFDTSGYFLNGLFRNHYGSVRSEAGLAAVMAALAD